jgi:hypothetical protein
MMRLTPTALFWMAVPLLLGLFYRLAPLVTLQPKTKPTPQRHAVQPPSWPETVLTDEEDAAAEYEVERKGRHGH